MSLFSNDIVRFSPISYAGVPVDIGAVVGLSNALNTQLITPQTGDPYDNVQSIVTQSPDISFRSNAIASVLNIIGFPGLCIDTDVDDPGFEAYTQLHDPCAAGGRASGSNHMQLTIGTGHAVIESISADANGNAEISVRVHATSTDGTTEPISVVFNAALPSNPGNEIRQFGLGKVNLTTVGVIDNLISVNIDYNVQLDKPQYAGSIWPKLVDVRKIQTMITIRSNDATLFQASKVPLTGLEQLHASAYIDLYRRAANGGFEPLASTVHCRGTINGMAHISQAYQASGDSVGTTEIQIAHVYDGSAVPIVWDTAAAVN